MRTHRRNKSGKKTREFLRNVLNARFWVPSAQVGERMNGRVVIGVVLLLVAVVYFIIAPAFMISDGTEVILWANIVPGIVLAVLGIILLATGMRGKKESA